jgi:hypothetical protein
VPCPCLFDGLSYLEGAGRGERWHKVPDSLTARIMAFVGLQLWSRLCGLAAAANTFMSWRPPHRRKGCGDAGRGRIVEHNRPDLDGIRYNLDQPAGDLRACVHGWRAIHHCVAGQHLLDMHDVHCCRAADSQGSGFCKVVPLTPDIRGDD